MKHRPFTAILIAIAFSATVGCSVLTPAAKRIRDADDRIVASCTFLGEFTGSSIWNGLAASQGIEDGRNSVRNDAARRGATHIVWSSHASGTLTTVSGRAYDCRPR
jgi:hypothetical protein